MLVSIIIVNYNVKYFLEQCLSSVLKATADLSCEVFVVDNNSTDGSISYLESKFSTVHFIANTENVGFAKANNKALQYCNGDYILYLNPDTIICEDCIKKCVLFFETHPDCGGLGVRMIDGAGNFLPESKRAFPSPKASFFKLTGLSKIFPQSKLFNEYALGHLDEYKDHEIDVIAGAFLMGKRNIIDACKGFDEIFFMYGEDIDLSYRIQKMGFKNYYLSQVSIIHFKGESIKKGSVGHIKLFYGAMRIFVQKHFGKGKGKLFANGISFAIFFSALASFIKSVIHKIGLQILDAILIVFSLFIVKICWIALQRDGLPFPQQYAHYVILGFAGIYLLAGALSGMYDNYKPSKALIASISSIVLILATYSLLPESQRFSRGVVVIGGLVAGLMIAICRWLLITLKLLDIKTDNYNVVKQTVVVGSLHEYHQVATIFKQAGLEQRLVGRVAIVGDTDEAIGMLHQLYLLIKSMKIKEVVFCEGTLLYHQIIQTIQTLPHNISYRFIGNGTSSIVGSDSNATTGETFTADGFYQINQAYHKRMKRIVDIGLSVLLIVSFPITLLVVKKGGIAIKNACYVLFGNYSWVGYASINNTLPYIKPNIITCYGLPVNAAHPLNKEALYQLNYLYAKNYDCWQDVVLLFNKYKQLGGL